MKIGIITIHNSTNYGACLQSWGLYKYLVDAGYDCEIIDLHRPVHKDYIYSDRFVDYNGKCSAARKWTLKKFLKRYIFKRKEPDYLIRRNSKFDRFNSRIKLSKTYRNIDELYAVPPVYDVYITGSDQVWNPTQPFCIEPYFLTFVKNPQAKRISYAASIGIEKLTDKEKSDFKQWLEKYDVISVRESEAKDLLESFVDKKICQVPDPTFLLGSSYWRSIVVKPQIKEPYILCFKLYNGNHLVSYAAEIGRQANMKVIVLPNGDDIPGCEIIRDAGPEEFLGYIANAEMLISDSFHANVFGILLGTKNQWAYIHPDNKRGSRLKSLFKTFGLSEHFISPDLSDTYDRLGGLKKDKDLINQIADEETRLSHNFLTKALDEYK